MLHENYHDFNFRSESNHYATPAGFQGNQNVMEAQIPPGFDEEMKKKRCIRATVAGMSIIIFTGISFLVR